jgi:squalene cyclase
MSGSFPIALHSAIDRATGFLISRQGSDGCWSDWDLPPGRADAWTTAYIGGKLSRLRCQQRLRTLEPTANAARWLVAHEWSDGGWGYNRSVASDADSTAWAILLLDAEGVVVRSRAGECLARFQRPDGGFSTYPNDEGLQFWGHSHADVTAVAAQATLRCGSAERLAHALRYLRAQRRANGLWNSYWWVTPLYATAACLHLLTVAGATTQELAVTRCGLESVVPANPFETALLLDALLHVCDRRAVANHEVGVRTLVTLLLDWQMPDGSWPSEPALRVPDRNCATPWSQVNAGMLYADPERLFTSATVLQSLACAAECLSEQNAAT